MVEDRKNVEGDRGTSSAASSPRANNANASSASDGTTATVVQRPTGGGSFPKNRVGRPTGYSGYNRNATNSGYNRNATNSGGSHSNNSQSFNRTGAHPYQFNKRKFVFKKRECYFTKNNVPYVDYKDVNLLKMFVGYNGQILISRFTGLKPKYQRRAAIAVKRARFMALLPFVGEVKKYNPRRDERQGQHGDFRPKTQQGDAVVQQDDAATISQDASAVNPTVSNNPTATTAPVAAPIQENAPQTPQNTSAEQIGEGNDGQ